MKLKFGINPITIFVLSIIFLLLSFYLYLHWYLESIEMVNNFMTSLPMRSKVFENSGIIVPLITLSILLILILSGLGLLFTYYHKSSKLYKQQQNFINNFTHELKTPIASMKLYLETFLKHDVIGENKEKFFNYMLKDADRLHELVDQILLLSHLENKGEKYKLDLNEMNSVMNNLLKKNAHFFKNDIIEYKTKINKKFVPLHKNLFEILIMNLLHNSKKYNNNQVKIRIEVSEVDSILFVAVRDNGIGFKKHYSQKVFKKFFQIGNADNCSAKGSGLGLYLCQQIIRHHRGRIKCYSEGEASGAIFYLSLPTYLGQTDGILGTTSLIKAIKKWEKKYLL